MKRGLAAVAMIAALLAGGGVPRARAGTEEFSTFTVFGQETDDESLLDHLLTRPPQAWRDEWERSALALRTSQGCLTSSRWFLLTQLKLRAPMGRRARFGLDLRQDESDRVSFDYLDFTFRYSTPVGVAGLLFRPLFDKSRQDLGVFYEAGEESSATRLRLAFTIEDTFNELWAFRQTRVGESSEPYERHPFEPAAWFLVRRPSWRAEAGGQWLTSSRKRLEADVTGFEPRATLWGALASGALEGRIGDLRLEAAGSGKQARSGLTSPSSATAGHDFRSQWSVEGASVASLRGGVEAEARWLYQERFEEASPPLGDHLLEAIDRTLQIELRGPTGWGGPRLGFMHDRITVAQRGGASIGHGSRIESRLYVGLTHRFGSVLLHAVEGIELDREPYEVWWVHDKAFFHLQTTF